MTLEEHIEAEHKFSLIYLSRMLKEYLVRNMYKYQSEIKREM